MLFRFRHETLGGHTHIRVFAGEYTLGHCGNLVMTNEEWQAFREVLALARSQKIELVEETDESRGG